jgi:UTP--glucose-1-phosphate uridylyltransferase
MHKPVRKAVFPVAGLGTRLLPATKSIPKEMLTIVDRPIIEIVFEEAREAGIEQFIFVTGRNKTALEDHFDSNAELEAALAKKGDMKRLEMLARILPKAGELIFTRQQKPLGLGHAVWCARHAVGDEPFAVLLPDVIMQSQPGCLTQMIDVYNERGGNVIATEEVPQADVSRYGVVGFSGRERNVMAIDRMVEKPKAEDAPSNHTISGRYILQPEIFGILESGKPGAGGEIQLTDAMVKLLAQQPFFGVAFDGATYDCGDRLGFLMANVARGLANEEIGFRFRSALMGLLAKPQTMPTENPPKHASDVIATKPATAKVEGRPARN